MFVQGIFSNEFMNKLDSEIKMYDDSRSYNAQLRYLIWNNNIKKQIPWLSPDLTSMHVKAKYELKRARLDFCENQSEVETLAWNIVNIEQFIKYKVWGTMMFDPLMKDIPAE